MKSDVVKTIDKNGIKRTMSRVLFDILPVQKDGSRGQNGITEIFEGGNVHPVAKEIGDYIKAKKEESSECCGKHDDCEKKQVEIPEQEDIGTVILPTEEQVIEPVNDTVNKPEAKERKPRQSKPAAKRGRAKK